MSDEQPAQNVVTTPTEEHYLEFSSCLDLAIYIRKFIQDNKKTTNTIEQFVVLKNSYLLLINYQFDLQTNTENPVYGYLITKNPIEAIKVDIIKNIESLVPIYKSFEYNIINTTNTNVVNLYDITLKISVSPNEEGSKKPIVNISIDKAVKKEIDNSKLLQESIDILKKYPFLIGVAGIKEILIPVLFDNDAVIQEIEGFNYLTMTSSGLSQFFTKIDIFTTEEKKEAIEFPAFILQDKIYVNISSFDKDSINLFRAKNYQYGNFTFNKTTTFVPILFGDIKKTLEDADKNKINDLKIATTLNDYIVKKYKEEIITLIKNPPIPFAALTEAGLDINEIFIISRIASLFMQNGVAFEKDDLELIKNIYSIKNLMSDTQKIITDSDINTLMTIETFYKLASIQNKEYQNISPKEALLAMADRAVTVPYIQFQHELQKHFELSNNKLNSILHDIDNSGYMETINKDENAKEEEKDIKLTSRIREILGE